MFADISSKKSIIRKAHVKAELNDSAIPKIYVDTNILQGAISRRDTDAIVFLDKAKEKGWEISTSIHTLMELLDVAKDRQFLMRCVYERWTDVNTFMRKRGAKDLGGEDLSNLAKEVNNFFLTYKTIKFININDSDWNLVKKIGETSNLNSSDILHLVTAYVGGCRVLATHDGEFIKEGNKVLEQERVGNLLRVCDIIGMEEKIKEICSSA